MIKKTLKFNDVLKNICEELKINNRVLTSIFNCNKSLIYLYLTNKRDVSYKNALLLKEELNRRDIDIYKFIFKNDNKYFHGSKMGIKGDIDPNINKKQNYDFGKGFYVGETFMQSSTFVCGYDIDKLCIYTLDINLEGLRYIDLTPKDEKDFRWIMFVAFNRGYIKEDEFKELYESIKSVSSIYDYIKGPIADDRMMSTMESFFNNKITSIDLYDCLTSMNLGNQYCFLTYRSCKNIKIKEEIKLDKTMRQLIQEYELDKHTSMIKFVNKISNKDKKEGLYFNEIVRILKERRWKILEK